MSLRRIMIVDDDVPFRKGLEIVLSDYCEKVVTERSRPDTLAWVRSFAPQAVVIDPDGSGLELARKIKAEMPQVRVILLSLFDQYLDAALTAGVDGYLLKGCHTDELVAALQSDESAANSAPAHAPQVRLNAWISGDRPELKEVKYRKTIDELSDFSSSSIANAEDQN